MIKRFGLPICTLFLLFTGLALAERLNVDLTSDWKFIKQDVPPDAPTDSWQTVSVPHTWNVEDGATGKKAEEGKESYYRGPGWYERALDIKPEWKGKRVYLRFEAASLVADVYVNGQKVGQHRGGFAAFCYDVSSYLHFDGKNELRVRVDSSRTMDVPPILGDFTVYGGLYRPVHLIVTEPVSVSLLYFASPGVFLTVKTMTPQAATVEARTILSNGGTALMKATVQTEITDADGKVVDTQTSQVDVAPAGPNPNLPDPVTDAGPAPASGSPTMADAIKNAATASGSYDVNAAIQNFQITQPHLWAGRPDPYLYSVVVHVLVDGKEVDTVTQPLGIRTIAITKDQGVLLNGQPYAMHGVSRHQEVAGKGWAASDADHDADFKIIEELGATCVRLAHYQQCNHVHEIADHDGIILWQEIPCVEVVKNSDAFMQNAEQQLTEMILQGYNHPSLGMWGLFNELKASWSKIKSDPPEPIIQTFHDLANRLDTTRSTVAASCHSEQDALYSIPDNIGYNLYPGWYWGTSDLLDKSLNTASEGVGGKMVALTEYGAGANPNQHQEGPLKQPGAGGPRHPEEWQSHQHEVQWAQIKANPHVWGSYVWAMFDFASCGRNEGSQPGVNDKGLVTRDRQIKKDAFYFYKANWNPDPMVYISSRRETERKMATTDIKVYSNCSSVELKVNGQSISSVTPDDIHIALWKDVKLSPGQNTIEADGQSGDKAVTDQCQWTLGN